MPLSNLALFLLVAALGGAAPAPPTPSAPDWPQWRGPERDGVVAAGAVPGTWPAALRPRWRLEVGSGYSSPVTARGRIFVHGRRDPDEVVSAADLATGKLVWEQKYPAPFAQNQYAVERAKGPHATPLLADGRLFTLGVTGVLSAWNPESGALLWRRDFSPAIDTSKLFCGTAASPLLEGGNLIVQVGSDLHGGKVLALDPATGAERWSWSGAGPGYASPVVIDVAGAASTARSRQIVTLTNGALLGLDAATGRQLWAAPFPDDWHENIMTPVWTGTHLVISGPRQGTHAFALKQADGAWSATEAWRNESVTMYMSTPVLADGTLYGHSSKKKGQFVALDAASGALRWASDGLAGEHASILLTPAHVVYLTSGGELQLVRRSAARLEVERRYQVADRETWAMPVVLPDGLVLRDASGLVRLEAGG